MTISCNGIPGVIAWASVIALWWFALCLPVPGAWRVWKIAAVVVFGYYVFVYVFRWHLKVARANSLSPESLSGSPGAAAENVLSLLAGRSPVQSQ